MPDAQGHLSPVEITAIQEWLVKHHGGEFLCPVSRHAIWMVNEYVYQNLVFPIQGIDRVSISPLAWPVVQVMCAGCGYVLNFSATMIGLYPSPRLGPSWSDVDAKRIIRDTVWYSFSASATRLSH